MKHLTRAGALLAALVVALATVFVLNRAAVLPAFLEDFGFHRPASEHRDNVEEWMRQPLQYLEPSYCSACHQDTLERWQREEHGSVNCESCHGPAREHAETQASLVVDTSMELCALCHAPLSARPDGFPQVDLDDHGAGQSECIACHDPHDPSIGAPSPVPHALEGRTDCLLCHGSGSIRAFPPDHVKRGNEICLDCHQAEEPSSLPTSPPQGTSTPTPTATPPPSLPAPTPEATPEPTPTPTVTPTPVLPTATPTPTLEATPTATARPSPATPMPEATPTPFLPTLTPTSVPAGGPPSVPHPVEGRADCLLCHGSGSMRPFPTDHIGRGNETCLACHRGGP